MNLKRGHYTRSDGTKTRRLSDVSTLQNRDLKTVNQDRLESKSNHEFREVPTS